MLKKTVRFSDEVTLVLNAMEWSEDGTSARIVQKLDRSIYTQVNKALELLGGKWDRKSQSHLFPEDPRTQIEGLIESGSLTIDKDGFFETPKAVVLQMLQMSPPTGWILEPSAGRGAILDVLQEWVGGIAWISRRRHYTWAIEKNPDRCRILEEKGYQVRCGDFLAMDPAGLKYDRIYMNPPFENMQDVDHVRHAYKFLSDTGCLISIMSESPFFRTDRKACEFRDWLEQVDGYWEHLPDGSFKESGTEVRARIVQIIRSPILESVTKQEPPPKSQNGQLDLGLLFLDP